MISEPNIFSVLFFRKNIDKKLDDSPAVGNTFPFFKKYNQSLLTGPGPLPQLT